MIFDGYSVLLGLVMLLVLVPLALVIAFFALRWLDRVFEPAELARNAGVFQATIAPKITAEPMAAAVYFGLRFVGVCWLLGDLFSRVI